MKVDIFNTGKKYKVIYADPPWRQSKHSKKPLIAYEIIESLYPQANRLELYARNERDGWDCWGNEV